MLRDEARSPEPEENEDDRRFINDNSDEELDESDKRRAQEELERFTLVNGKRLLPFVLRAPESDP